MRLLLDTHVFLWHLNGSKALPADLRAAIQDPANTVFLSPVSIWEALVKYRLGKLPLPASPHIYLPEQRRRHRIETLPLDEPSVARVAGLPDLHRDPFDRMLVCQALEHGLTLATVDPAVRAYPVPVW
jgi:PIN domain nuclease of toxin-antitoxin system